MFIQQSPQPSAEMTSNRELMLHKNNDYKSPHSGKSQSIKKEAKSLCTGKLRQWLDAHSRSLSPKGSISSNQSDSRHIFSSAFAKPSTYYSSRLCLSWCNSDFCCNDCYCNTVILIFPLAVTSLLRFFGSRNYKILRTSSLSAKP